MKFNLCYLKSLKGLKYFIVLTSIVSFSLIDYGYSYAGRGEGYQEQYHPPQEDRKRHEESRFFRENVRRYFTNGRRFESGK